nr:hypothetical protein CFP56_38938 [Quercus suber]
MTARAADTHALATSDANQGFPITPCDQSRRTKPSNLYPRLLALTSHISTSAWRFSSRRSESPSRHDGDPPASSTQRSPRRAALHSQGDEPLRISGLLSAADGHDLSCPRYRFFRSRPPLPSSWGRGSSSGPRARTTAQT